MNAFLEPTPILLAPVDESGTGYSGTASTRWCLRSGDTEAIPAVS
ncbi:hypothetical protein [Roseiconus lacunae]|uniref:Uncharacterized protein n=1 Tax=Roseiconus lacunae TaxID=2605694 RepID=A0ABT7PQR2_9BACT|nr:hypothetical protein [Roseiconus lacunae]MDM4018619.1 hypothetical protein [Roseiconus lacunae]